MVKRHEGLSLPIVIRKESNILKVIIDIYTYISIISHLILASQRRSGKLGTQTLEQSMVEPRVQCEAL